MEFSFSKDGCPDDAETLDVDSVAHECLRKAIRHCDGDDYIVLPQEAAMQLILEWDGLKGRRV